MACGVPVVASDVVGISEVVDERHFGALFPPGDARAISEAVARIIAEPDEAAEMGRRGREAELAHYAWEACVRQRALVVDEAIRAARQCPPGRQG
jgi:glycosyltransferase involved in cell wall biosynthesis